MLENILDPRIDFINGGIAEANVHRATPLSFPAKLYASAHVRKLLVITLLGVIWQVYAVWLDNPLAFPTLTSSLRALAAGLASGELLQRAWVSISVLTTGYSLGVLVAFLFVSLASTSRLGGDLLETITSTLNPLPAIALLPLAMMWFGLGNQSLVFVLVHAVTWPVALNAHAGFRAVSPALRMVGRNYGLSGVSLVISILLPAAFPALLAGLKIGWAFAWRTLIAAELVFGVSSGSGGLGWYLFENKNSLQTPEVFGGLLMIIFIGLLVDGVIFSTIERHTVRKWGMQQS
jgi:NitT/TauT family transport system permease protein